MNHFCVEYRRFLLIHRTEKVRSKCCAVFININTCKIVDDVVSNIHDRNVFGLMGWIYILWWGLRCFVVVFLRDLKRKKYEYRNELIIWSSVPVYGWIWTYRGIHVSVVLISTSVKKKIFLLTFGRWFLIFKDSYIWYQLLYLILVQFFQLQIRLWIFFFLRTV